MGFQFVEDQIVFMHNFIVNIRRRNLCFAMEIGSNYQTMHLTDHQKRLFAIFGTLISLIQKVL